MLEYLGFVSMGETTQMAKAMCLKNAKDSYFLQPKLNALCTKFLLLKLRLLSRIGARYGMLRSEP
jgi:hypothetical protein